MRYLLMALMLQIGTAGAAQVHVCTGADGKKTFQSMPCSGSAAVAEVKEYKVAPPSEAAGDNRLTTDNPIYQQMKADNRRAQLERDIKKAERNIEKYRQKMDAEIAALRNKKRYAANNQAGATWEQSISTEMQAVSSKYTSMIDVERDRISQMRQEVAGL